MRYGDIARLSTRMFKTNPSRTWLTILGMGVGTAAVVSLVGLGFGLQAILLEQIILGETLLSLNVSNPPSQITVLNQDTVDTLLREDLVKDVSPMVSFPALITFQGLSGNVYLQGLNPSYFRYVGTKAVEGELFTEESEASDRNNVVVSEALLKLFEIEDSEEAIGKRVSFRVFVPQEGGLDALEVNIDKKFTIIGVTNDPANIIAMITMREFESHFQVPFFERVQVRVLSTDALNPVTDVIVEKGFVVTALSKTVDQAKKIFGGLQAVLGVFGGIALMVSAIGMFNTMTVTLLERTGEIGIMRTIGASPQDIKVLFISEAMIVGFLGGVVGILIGVSIGFGLNEMLAFAASRFGGQAVDIFAFPLPFLAFILSFSTIVGFITGIFPARRAAALNPLDAIRYK